MQKIHLDISSDIADKVLNFLNKLPKNHLKIEIEPTKYDSNTPIKNPISHQRVYFTNTPIAQNKC